MTVPVASFYKTPYSPLLASKRLEPAECLREKSKKDSISSPSTGLYVPRPPACLRIQAPWGPCEPLAPATHSLSSQFCCFFRNLGKSGFLPERDSIAGRNEKIKNGAFSCLSRGQPSIPGWQAASFLPERRSGCVTTQQKVLLTAFLLHAQHVGKPSFKTFVVFV